MNLHHWSATAPKPFEDLLLVEVQSAGGCRCRVHGSRIDFEGDLRVAYRLVLYSRIASRVMLDLAHAPVETADDIYAVARSVEWSALLNSRMTLCVQFRGRSAEIRDSRFGAQRIKDAIVDRFGERGQARPSVDREDPDLRIVGRLANGRLTLSLDVGGSSLHRRGYRSGYARAPLKENIAAALLMRAGWPSHSDEDLIDPMCGSGTFLIEAAMMAERRPPGLLRPTQGFGRWLGHDATLWSELLEEARERVVSTPSGHRFFGADLDARALSAARNNVRQASLSSHFEFQCIDARHYTSAAESGLLVCNLPFGERLAASSREVRSLYREVTEAWASHFPNFRFALLTPQASVTEHLKLKIQRRHSVSNGAISCWWLQGEINTTQTMRSSKLGRTALANRLKKNFRRLSPWARDNRIDAYRLYDADLPEYAAAIDCYRDWVLVQEYAAPASIDRRVAEERLDELIAMLPEIVDISAQNIVVEVRKRQRGRNQYCRVGDLQRRLVVREGEVKFLVNLHDYLDTGLFLDHRPIRRRIGKLCGGRSFLNLFCYTAAASVHAAAGGAARSVSVDTSRTYLAWAEENFRLNGLWRREHRLVRADALKFLRECDERFDVIFCDPPTFSNSKSRTQHFSVHDHHRELIEFAMQRLCPEGLLLFSSNARRFCLDPAISTSYAARDITPSTIPKDFSRRARIHRCYELRHAPRGHPKGASLRG